MPNNSIRCHAIETPPCAAGRLIAHESRNGDLSRSPVRRLSVLQALSMLTQLAETV
jgi:hypothetical protein